MASIIGLYVPAAKGAMVIGISAADMILGEFVSTLKAAMVARLASQTPSGSCHGWVMAEV